MTFVDQVIISIRSGDGGNGIVAWRREKYEPLGGPAGGDGGDGGDVYLQADNNISTLLDFRYKSKFEASPGVRGGSKNKYGRQGENLIIKVPVGTVATDRETGNVIADLIAPGDKVLVAEGGQGGRGNAKLSSPTRRAPHYCEPGQPGIERKLELELKLLADVGLIGMPNAGKSTLLSVLTAARPKIADYPFSTLVPNLGVVKKPDGDGYVMADIPGLVKGASQGIGLGHKFLRHIERTRLLIHLADICDPDLEENIKTVNQELSAYSNNLASLPQILVLNKVDLLTPAVAEERLAQLDKDNLFLFPCNSAGIAARPYMISCATRAGLDKLTNQILESLAVLQPHIRLYEVAEDPIAREHVDSGFTIQRHKKVFSVSGERINRLVDVTDMRDPESLYHMRHVLKAMGLFEALLEAGATSGCEVIIAGVAFSFGEDL